jgi:type I restriction enzyme S subunit
MTRAHSVNNLRVPTRRFAAYPGYKDSGVDYLGQIPNHWIVERLKYLTGLNPETLPEDTDPEREMIYVDIGGVDKLGRISDAERLPFASSPSRARRVVRNGDIIVSTVRTYLRAIAPIRDPEPNMVVSTGFAVVRPIDDLTTDYAAYALRAPYFVERVVANSKGVSFPAINETEMATYEIAVPPKVEQRTIAAFLDKETARIDALVAKRERLIDLLHEQRTALIKRAVTKGLDPNVAVKDSGVEWLGRIPAAWKCLALSHATVSRCDGPFGSGLKSTHYSPTGVRVIRLQNIGWTAFADTDNAYIDDAYAAGLGDHSVIAGDLLIAGLGDDAHPVGRACVAPLGIEPAMVKADCFRFRLNPHQLDARFAAYQLSATASATAGALSTGATRSRINLSVMATRKVAVPPLAEQHAIVEHLDHDGSNFRDLVRLIQLSNGRLHELRDALISAAVSGKIDVRGEFA